MLGFVDDAISIQNCGPLSIEKNAASNSFMQCTKQVKNTKKTSVVYIGNKVKCNNKCPKLYVNDTNVKESDKEKYLGNLIASKKYIQKLIDIRVTKPITKEI